MEKEKGKRKKVAQLNNNKVRQSRIFFTERQYEKDKESKECHKKKKVRIKNI